MSVYLVPEIWCDTCDRREQPGHNVGVEGLASVGLLLMSISPAAQVRLRSACYPVVRAINNDGYVIEVNQ